LANEQQALEQRHGDLNTNAADINANAEHLRQEQTKISGEHGDSWLNQHSLMNEQKFDGAIGSHARQFGERFSDDSPGMHKLDTYQPKDALNPGNWKPSNLLHHGIPGVPKPTVGDSAGIAKEAARQALSDQPAREDKISAEYQDQQGPVWPAGER
jgi:hypothetical protein